MTLNQKANAAARNNRLKRLEPVTPPWPVCECEDEIDDDADHMRPGTREAFEAYQEAVRRDPE